MKLCIKLNDWAKTEWERKKDELEYSIEREFGKSVTVSKHDVLTYLLINFEDGSTPLYVEMFEEEEIEVMHKRKLGLLKSASNEESVLD